MAGESRRRQDDRASWEKVAHNITLMGSALAALLMGIRAIGGYYRDQEKLTVIEKAITSNTTNIQIITKRLSSTEREIDRNAPRILDNEKEIERLRNHQYFYKKIPEP